MQFDGQTPLGAFAPAERRFRAWVVKLKRFQVQLVPQRVGQAHQWQLLRRELQIAEGKFCVELCYTREISLRV